jgi:universal stress protein F
MIGKILVPLPVDSAASGSEALAMAVDIAKANGSKLVLLHVHETMPGYVSAHLPADFAKEAVKTTMADLASTAKKHGIGKECEIVVRSGNPAAEILEFADDAGIDMIVMASHDPVIADYLLGSVAARVVRHAHCSVLVVRHPKS